MGVYVLYTINNVGDRKYVDRFNCLHDAKTCAKR
jgi:hypothetical protein